VICCGSERTSAYCPHCGKKLTDKHGLEGLVAQCHKVVKRTVTEARKWEARALDGSNRHAERWGKSARASSVKWGEWAKLLEELMQTKATKGE
jgi:hypothetical protein